MMLRHIATHPITTAHGVFQLSGFLFGDNQQVVLVLTGCAADAAPATPFVRIQYGCVNGTVFQATDCDCALQIGATLKRMAEKDGGVFIYFADHEGFGLGLAGKMQVVAEEKRIGEGFLEIVQKHGVPAMSSDVLWTVPHILKSIGLSKRIILLGKNAYKIKRLTELGVDVVEAVELEIDEALLSPEAVRERNQKRFRPA